MYNRRLQLVLDEGRYRRVAEEAQRRGVSMAVVIREAIDEMPDAAGERRAAIDALLAAEPMPLPEDPKELRRELDAARVRDRA